MERYKKLNELAKTGGVVIFGGTEDKTIPLGELRQAFEIEERIYNRSTAGLSVKNALAAYEETVAVLEPETVLLHLGAEDQELFVQDRDAFVGYYRQLIESIRKQNKKCRIAIVSLRNYGSDPQIKQINESLKYFAQAERCEYCDIADRKLWNPQSIKETASFLYDIGFVRPLKVKRPLYDLVKMLYCDLVG